MMTTLTIEQILMGTMVAERQTVGNMEVIPLVAVEEEDEFFAPPNFHASTREYGSIHLRNSADAPSIVPTGAGWVVDEAAQDHAVCSASFIKANSEQDFNLACCIQETQAGLISENQGNMLILPASIRTHALAVRKDREYSRLWNPIRNFKDSVGLTGSGNLVDFLRHFKKQLDEFIAEFELVPKQVGAVVLVGGKVVGIERAPSVSFWEKLWVPLVRVCYGSLAVQVAHNDSNVYSNVASLNVEESSLEGIQKALKKAFDSDRKTTCRIMSKVNKLEMNSSGKPDAKMGKFSVTTLANKVLSGQIVSDSNNVKYASLCLSASNL